MAITITCLDDANHTISSSKKILSRQGELGETITFSLPSTLNVAYPRAWIMVQQPDGQLYYIDNGSGAGFTWPNPYTFTYDIGDRDTMLSSDGTLGIQIVLRDATPPAQTVEWRSRILYLTIEGSILSNVDSGGSLIDSLSSGTLNRLADIQYDSLADGDLLYRDTATGKWRNVTLVDGLNITHTLNKLTGELTFNSSGTIPLKADNILLDDTAGRISSTQVEGAIAEIAGTGRTTESLANIGLLSSLTTTEKGTVVGSINEVNAQLAQTVNRLDQLEASTAVYGVRFTNASSAPAGTRLFSAVGLTATAGVGERGSSDFDDVDLFKLRTCNRANGVVTAYYGEPGFSLSNDTFVEIPKGHYRVWNDGTYTNYAVSKSPFYGSAVHPAFKHNSGEQDYVYIARYMSSYDGSSKHESKTGSLPDIAISRTTARTRSKSRGAYAILQDVQIRDWLNILMAVEFATRDIQTAVGLGYCDMPYASTHDATVAGTAVNRIIIANAYADLYVVGQEISIGTAEGNNSIAADRTVTGIAVYDASNKAISFDGTAVNIAIGNNVWSSRQKNGKCDSIGQGTGRATGTTGKTSVIYRGIENLWGNIWEWVDNLNIRNNQGYTDIEGRIASYNDTDFGTVYSALSAAFPATNNYMVTPLIDSVSGLSCLPATVGGSSSTYYCDYYYQATGDRAARVGGVLYAGSYAGPWSWDLLSEASGTHWGVGARLLEIPA